MTYSEYIPNEILKPYVKCYYLYESGTDAVIVDKAFATGCMEIMFNLGDGRWQADTGNGFHTTPLIELWGQVIQPLTFKSLSRNTMLGVRFYPHTACVFLNTEVSQFNNRIGELPAGIHTSIRELHSKLLDTTLMHSRIELLDEFLLHRLSLYETKLNKTALISHVISELKQKDFFDNIENVASRYGITARYLQKLFIQHTGITPKLYSKINRFQNSLMLMSKKNSTLTDIAYECGYFDQSHFIREFKSFTGYIPSGFDIETSSAVFASPNK